MKKRTRTHSLSRYSLKHQALPVIVWLGMVTIVVGLFYQRTQEIQVLGLVRGQTHRVAAACTGRIQKLHVGLYDTVEAGQALVTIDTLSKEKRLQNDLLAKELTAEQDTLKVSIEHLRAQLTTKEQQLVDDALRLRTERTANERIFSVAVETAQMRLLELERQLVTEKASQKTLAEEIVTLDLLVNQKAIAPQELVQAQYKQESLDVRIELYTQLYQKAEDNYQEALQRQADFLSLIQSAKASSQDKADNIQEWALRIKDVAQKEIEVQIQRIAEIQQRLKNLHEEHIIELKAPFAGMVSELSLGAEEVVNVNTPVLRLAQLNPTEVIAYIPERLASKIQSGMEVEVIRNTHPLQIAQHCQVTAIGPIVEQVPQQLWLQPNSPQWGRSFLIRVPAEFNLLVGERVGIRKL